MLVEKPPRLKAQHEGKGRLQEIIAACLGHLSNPASRDTQPQPKETQGPAPHKGIFPCIQWETARGKQPLSYS